MLKHLVSAVRTRVVMGVVAVGGEEVEGVAGVGVGAGAAEVVVTVIAMMVTSRTGRTIVGDVVGSVVTTGVSKEHGGTIHHRMATKIIQW